MGILDSLNEMQPNTILLIIVVIAATICPGILAIYLFRNNLFFSLDVWKLILLSLAFTVPFLLVSILIQLPRNSIKGQAFQPLGCIFSSGIQTFDMLIVGILVAYFFKLGLFWFIIIALILETINFVILLFQHGCNIKRNIKA